MPILSTIVPCYNQARYIRQTLESVRAQQLADWECIIIDDGSTDGSREIIQQVIAGDPRFRYYHQHNQGLSAARNAGAARACAPLFHFLDSDDLIHPELYQVLQDQFNRFPESDILHVLHDEIDEQGVTIASPTPPLGCEQPTLAHFSMRNLFPPFTAVMRRHVYATTGPFDPALKSLEDWDYWLRAASLGHTFRRIDRRLGRYRRHGDNMSGNLLRMVHSAEQVLEKHQEILRHPAGGGREARPLALLNHYCSHYTEAHRTDNREALEYLEPRLDAYPTTALLGLLRYPLTAPVALKYIACRRPLLPSLLLSPLLLLRALLLRWRAYRTTSNQTRP